MKNAIDCVAALSNIVAELETDFAYLSEETDRWGTEWNWKAQKRACASGERSTATLIVEHVAEFEKLRTQACNLRIHTQKSVAQLFRMGHEYTYAIQQGKFLSYSAIVDALSNAHD